MRDRKLSDVNITTDVWAIDYSLALEPDNVSASLYILHEKYQNKRSVLRRQCSDTNQNRKSYRYLVPMKHDVSF